MIGAGGGLALDVLLAASGRESALLWQGRLSLLAWLGRFLASSALNTSISRLGSASR